MGSSGEDRLADRCCLRVNLKDMQAQEMTQRAEHPELRPQQSWKKGEGASASGHGVSEATLSCHCRNCPRNEGAVYVPPRKRTVLLKPKVLAFKTSLF